MSVLSGLLLALAVPVTGQNAPDARWLLAYQGELLPNGQYAVNQLIWDKRFLPFVARSLPQRQHFWSSESTAKVAREFLGVPGKAELVDGRYWSATGCVPHDCGDTGLLWFDTGAAKPLVIFAALVLDPKQTNRDRRLLFSGEALQLENLPPEFRARATQFASTTTALGHTIVAPLSTVILVGPNGTKHEYEPAQFMAAH